MLHIWDAQNNELTVIADETVETFKDAIIESTASYDVDEEFDFDEWLDDNQYTLINAGDIQKESVEAFIQW